MNTDRPPDPGPPGSPRLGGLRRLWTATSGRWNNFWFRSVSGVAFGLVRIAFGATLLLTLLEFAPLLFDQYTASGYFPISSARQWSWGNLIALFHVDALDTLGAIVAIYTTLLFATTLLMLGWHTRIAAATVFALLLWFQTRNPTYLNGGDEVLRLMAFYLFLGYLTIPPRSRSVSVDRWLSTEGSRSDRWLGGEMRIWPVRMIQIQICLVYAVAGAWKLAGDSWWTADAVFYATQNPQVARFILPAAAWSQPLFWVASLSTAWWEFTFPLTYAWKRTRKLALGFGVFLHVGVLLTMNIGFFSLAMLAAYPAFVGSENCRAWLLRLLKRGVLDASAVGEGPYQLGPSSVTAIKG